MNKHLMHCATLFLLLLAAACTRQDATWQRIAQDGVLRIGMDPTFPPFEEFAFDTVQGIDVDLAQALATELGLTTEFVFLGYDGLYDGLAVGRYDVLLSGIVPDMRRTQDFAFSEPYFNAGLVLITRADSAIGRIQEMADRTLAVELGADGHVTATEWQRQFPDLTVVPLASAEAALQAVLDESADAALVDNISAQLFLAAEPALIIVDEAVTVEPFAAVVRIEDEELLRRLDEALQKVAESGKLQQTISHWMRP
ncbi:MAG: ABC transporter substrate-binding protein [Anaerolineae bacterium]|nr:ABC transporter substrate-binding protein [Anaerolineae bacterium]